MIKYSRKIYTTASTEDRVNRIKHNLKFGIGMVDIYIIALSASKKDVFDIYPSTVFKQKKMREINTVVIGFAESRDAAFELVGAIIEEHYRLCGTYENLRSDFIRMMME